MNYITIKKFLIIIMNEVKTSVILSICCIFIFIGPLFCSFYLVLFGLKTKKNLLETKKNPSRPHKKDMILSKIEYLSKIELTSSTSDVRIDYCDCVTILSKCSPLYPIFYKLSFDPSIYITIYEEQSTSIL